MSRPRGSAATKRLRLAAAGEFGPGYDLAITARNPTLPRDRLPEQIFRREAPGAVAKAQRGAVPAQQA